MRSAPFVATLALGLGMAILGFLMAVPITKVNGGLAGISNPHVPFAPGLFLLGVVLIYLSAVVYELAPARRRGR